VTSPIGSKVISGDTQTDRNRHTHTHTHTQTDIQAGDLISPLSFFESRLIKFFKLQIVTSRLKLYYSDLRQHESRLTNETCTRTLSKVTKKVYQKEETIWQKIEDEID
jgi:hypothetical protein